MFARTFISAAFVLALPVLAAASILARADAASCDSDSYLVCCRDVVRDRGYGCTSLSLESLPPTMRLTELIFF
jgi:hypothetical protein